MSNSIAHVFGSDTKVKIMRLFIFNPNINFSSTEVIKRVKAGQSVVKKEINVLIKAGLIKKRLKTYTLNRAYKYLPALGSFLIDANPLSEKEINKRIASVGSLKLLIISGIFLHNPDSRVDILVVGDHLKQAKLISVMSAIESELGRELRYAVFETQDFKYRLSIYDKLIRDIFDAKHKKIVDKIGIDSRAGDKEVFQLA